jgi:hypothetical protein
MGMTRDEITSLVTTTVGQTDSASVTLCNTFVQRAYEMVWNAELWRDTVTIDTTGAVTAGVNTYTMPSGFDRVISLQLLSGGVPVGFLDPTTTAFILQTEPTALTTQGVPTKYEEFVHTDGTKKIRLFPLPNASYTLTMSGKRVCPTLGATDNLQIRNIDNAVIALATADMYTRQRQLGKAGEMAKKAGAFIEEARKIELEQTNKPRLSKTATVTVNNFGELVDAVCERVGTWTPDNVILARNFLKRRYRMIWDSFAWKDSLTTATASTTNAQNYITMPSGIERAISVTADGKLLDPVDAAYLMQVDPTIFTRSGVPLVFEERDVSGAKRIMLFPIPDAVYSVTVAGKKTITNLSADTDAPVIRNIDNVLIVFAASDLQARLGNNEQAKALVEEGSAELQALQKLESEQTFRARVSKPLTVAGNSLAEMTGAVAARTGQYAPDAAILIKDFLRRNYQQVYNSNLWTESTVEINVTSVTGILILPEFVDRVVAIRGNSNLGQLSAAQPSLFYGINPQIFEQTGDPLAFSYLTSVGMPILPTTAEPIRVDSSSANDKTAVFIKGEQAVTGDVISESLTLNGLASVVTTNNFLVLLTVAKNITSGNVGVYGNTSSVHFGTLLANERERKHIRIQFRPTPTANVACKVLCKRRITPFMQDEDTPLLRDIGNVLIELASADMFSKLGNKDGSMDAKAKADQALKTLIDLETQQGASSYQIVPEVETWSNWYDSDLAFISK